jgi:type I restriction enzyme S subunit
MTQTELTPTTSLTGKWKPYPAHKDSGVEWLGKIPLSWKTGKIGIDCTVKARLGWKGLKASEYVDEGFIFLSTPNIKGREIDFENVNYITSERYFESPEIMLKPGDVLIAKDGSTLGITGVVRFLPAPTTVNSSIAVIRPTKALNSVFLYWFLSSNYIQELIQSMKDGMGVPHLFQADIRKFIALIPPFIEQRAIASFLDRETARINALITDKERLIKLLLEKRAALISHAVTKGLDTTVPMKDSGVEWLGEIPAHWEVKRLKFVTSFVTSGSRGWAQYYSDEGAIFLRIGNLSRTSISLNLEDIQHVSPPEGTEGERTHVKQYDVLISITANIGSVAVVSEDMGEAYVNQHVALARPYRDAIDSKWFGYCLLSRVGQEQFYALLYGGTKDGLGLDDVRNLFLLVPLIQEQRTIATYLNAETSKIDALISKIRQNIEKLKEYSTALISAAVTGKIDVRDENAFAA